jgi:hypothetical protein
MSMTLVQLKAEYPADPMRRRLISKFLEGSESAILPRLSFVDSVNALGYNFATDDDGGDVAERDINGQYTVSDATTSLKTEKLALFGGAIRDRVAYTVNLTRVNLSVGSEHETGVRGQHGGKFTITDSDLADTVDIGEDKRTVLRLHCWEADVLRTPLRGAVWAGASLDPNVGALVTDRMRYARFVDSPITGVLRIIDGLEELYYGASPGRRVTLSDGFADAAYANNCVEFHRGTMNRNAPCAATFERVDFVGNTSFPPNTTFIDCRKNGQPFNG